LQNGDLRVLYLAWLLGVREGGPDQPHPPVPAKLKRPSAALRAFADFFAIEPAMWRRYGGVARGK